MKSIYDFPSNDEYYEYLRAYFAAAALSSIADFDASAESIASDAVKIADAVIKELKGK